MIKYRQLFIKFLEMTACLKNFLKIRYASFVFKDKKLLEKYESVWNKISNTIEKIHKQPVLLKNI